MRLTSDVDADVSPCRDVPGPRHARVAPRVWRPHHFRDGEGTVAPQQLPVRYRQPNLCTIITQKWLENWL